MHNNGLSTSPDRAPSPSFQRVLAENAPQVYQTIKTRTVRAAQWTGDNVAEIQTLLWPDSPLYQPPIASYTPELQAKSSIGVYVTRSAGEVKIYGAGKTLAFMDVGLWVTVDNEGAIEIWTDVQFTGTFGLMTGAGAGAKSQGGEPAQEAFNASAHL